MCNRFRMCGGGSKNFSCGGAKHGVTRFAWVCVPTPCAPEPLSRAIFGLIRLVLLEAGSNAQCNQHNNTDPDNQHRKRNGIIIQPVSALYTHDATSTPK
jgi:hypothetical protein